MNGSYSLADSPSERMAVAVVSANVAYFEKHKEGISPGYGFYAEFLKPFIEREIVQARLDQLHSDKRDEETRLVMLLKDLTQVCEQKVKPHGASA